MVTKRKKKPALKMTPKAHFEDVVTKGCARGVIRFMRNNRLTIVNLPVGYGKTNIAVMTAVGVAKMLNREVQIAVLAPVSKRLDLSFDGAIASAMKIYGVKLSRLQINNQDVGSFAGLVRTYKTTAQEREFNRRVQAKPTVFILDETHLYLRNPRAQGTSALRKILDKAQATNSFCKVVGLTATPTDNSILDTIGYLVVNGNYNSKTAFFRQEIINYKNLHNSGLTHADIEATILNPQYEIQVQVFNNIYNVLNQLKLIMYKPKAPRDFHIPKNVMQLVPVELSDDGLVDLKFYRKLVRDGGFANPTEKRLAFINTMTIDDNMVKRVIDAINSPAIKTPVVFYQTEKQRMAIKTVLDQQERPYLEVNGKSHSYFHADKITPKTAVLVQFQSGATAFEAKMSNTSLYLGLPDSSINFTQSLGRNTRRGQDVDIVHNYIFAPQDKRGHYIEQFDVAWERMKTKIHANDIFNDYFTTPWGQYEQVAS